MTAIMAASSVGVLI